MTQYYPTHYQYPDNANLTTAQENSRYEHIDTRLDALETHKDNTSNPHGVTASDVAAALSTHTHTFTEEMAWYKQTVTAGDIGPKPLVNPAATIAAAWATLGTASSSGSVTVDIQKSSDNGLTWATIFSTKLTVDQDELSSVSAATPCVLSVTAASVNDMFKVNIDSAGSGAADITVGLRLSRTVSVD